VHVNLQYFTIADPDYTEGKRILTGYLHTVPW